MTKQEIIELVKTRLTSLSYELKETDGMTLSFLYDRVIFDVKSFCNIQEVNEDMDIPVIDMITGYFLQDIYTNSYLSNEETNKDIKSISEGDISISYNTSNREQDFLNYSENLINNAKNNLIRFRRILW